jgi:predicted Zn-dependent peptidase
MKKLWFITLVLLQGVLMAAQLHELSYKEVKVPIIYEKGKIPIVNLQLVFTGAGHLANTQDGLADMSAKLLNEGTKKEGSVGFATKLDSKAIELGAHVGRESFVIQLSSLKSEFGKAVTYLSELLRDPNYTKEAFSHIKLQKEGWLQQKQSDFDYISATNLRGMLFKDTPLGNPYMGTPESIEKMKLQDIEKFITQHIGYNNLIVVIGGDLGFNEASKAVEKILPLLPKIDKKKVASYTPSNAQKIEEFHYETQQSYIYFGAPFHYTYDEQKQYLVKIAEYVLGSAGFGSRIMEEIRVKRGLAYSAYASLRCTKSASYLSGYLQTKLSSQDEAIQIVKKVIHDFMSKGITQKELEDTKKFLLGSEPLRTETLSQRLGRTFNDYYYGRPLDFSQQQLQQIERVTLKEINTFIKSHKELALLSFSVVTKKQPN